ncbi:MAG: helix-turn-helix transcriptional regulator [Erysipelotrichaceae bacterium]|nr:helix-turn-helix transcriptional regulator [Erysipelotrichaceae bacterium]
MNYRKTIINLREEKDWTQKEVALKLNISQRAYSHYENGTRQLPIDLLIKISQLYGVTTDYILGLSNNRKKAF